ncbi:MAG: tRNA modification GTPase [Phycisphaerae bacterium]|nr:tRNA modification GTPase [Phycisphaerae bacterium]
MIDRIDETIVAVSSAPGRATVGIIRISGPQSLTIAAVLFRDNDSAPLTQRFGARRYSGDLLLSDGESVPGVVHLFRAPRSYTRQDVVEILTPGSPPLLEMIRKECLSLGARPAEAGEFTARAFLSGSLSLDEAEAVAGIINAQSDAQLRGSRRLRDGALAQSVTAARDELAELLALVEAEIDFAEEPIEFITPDGIDRRLTKLTSALDNLLTGSVSRERLENLPTILLLGAPNAGKSTLMNRLTGTSRSICAAVAGTTRDLLSAPVTLPCGEAILLDSAGVDASVDEILSAARERALGAAERVDLILLLADLTAAVPGEVTAAVQRDDRSRVLLVGSKLDLVAPMSRHEVERKFAAMGFGQPLLVSAISGEGIDALREQLGLRIADQTATVVSETILLSQRQSVAIDEARSAVTRAVELANVAQETVDCAELLAFELREALHQLGTVTGEVTTEELLGQVFSRFCIGK